MVFLLCASSCKKTEPQVVTYLESFEQIDFEECQVVFVLPNYACAFCTKATFTWLEHFSETEAPWVITDNDLYEGFYKVIIEKDQDRMVQYNPYVNAAFVVTVKKGELISIESIGLQELKMLPEIYTKVNKGCSLDQ
tara:strand:+ start:1429 stop:1839 length:411 start_codon:yes stop_codon:yes gene_type:complete